MLVYRLGERQRCSLGGKDEQSLPYQHVHHSLPCIHPSWLYLLPTALNGMGDIALMSLEGIYMSATMECLNTTCKNHLHNLFYAQLFQADKFLLISAALSLPFPALPS